MPKKSKSYFGDYSPIGKVFGGKPSARTKRVTRNDYNELAGILIPAMGLIAYFIYSRRQQGKTATATLPIDPATSGTLALNEKPILKK